MQLEYTLIPHCTSLHLDLVLHVLHLLVTKVLDVNEPSDTAVQTGPHPNPLSRTAATINVLPHLQYTTQATKQHAALFMLTTSLQPYFTCCHVTVIGYTSHDHEGNFRGSPLQCCGTR